MHTTLPSFQPLASVNEDQFHFTVQGVRIEEELRERCRNSTVANTPTGPFCAERVNASVAFNVQGRVRTGRACCGSGTVQDADRLLVASSQ